MSCHLCIQSRLKPATRSMHTGRRMATYANTLPVQRRYLPRVDEPNHVDQPKPNTFVIITPHGPDIASYGSCQASKRRGGWLSLDAI